MTLCEAPNTDSADDLSPTGPERRARADAAHRIWSHWMKYFFSVCDFIDGKFVVPEVQASRWMRQCLTPFDRLSPSEQASDFDIADTFMPIAVSAALGVEDRKYFRSVANDVTGLDVSAGPQGWYISVLTGFPQMCVRKFGPFSPEQCLKTQMRLNSFIVSAAFDARIDKISQEAAFAAQATDSSQATDTAQATEAPKLSPVEAAFTAALSPVLDDAAKVDQWPSHFPDKNTIIGIERRRLSPDMWEVEVRGTNGFEHYFRNLCEDGAIICYDTLVKLVSAEVEQSVLSRVRYAKSVDGTRVATFFDWGLNMCCLPPLSGVMRCSIVKDERHYYPWIVFIEAVVDSRTVVHTHNFRKRGDAAAVFAAFSNEIKTYWESKGLVYDNISGGRNEALFESVGRAEYNMRCEGPLSAYTNTRVSK